MKLDGENRRIYWVNGGTGRIEAVNYQGNNRNMISEITGFHGLGVTMIFPFLVFTYSASGGVLHKLDADTRDYIVSDNKTKGKLMGILA